MFWIIPLGLVVVFELIADVFGKEYALKGSWQFWTLAILTYVVANAFWLWSIRSGSELARGAIIFSVASALFATIIGVHFFHEQTNFLQYVGFALGILSIICLLWK